MKKLFIFSLVSVITLTSCNWHKIRGNGSIKSETRDVAAFEAVTCDGGYDIQIKCQDKQSVTIVTDENLLPRIKTDVHNNTLRIHTKGMLFPTDGIQISISVPNITDFTSNGSTDGDINNINNNALDIKINGSGKLQLNGKSNTVKIHTSGSSRINAASLISDDSDVRINGSGNIQVYASNSIDVQINGSGTVKYKGEPKSINQQINGSGKIIKE